MATKKNVIASVVLGALLSAPAFAAEDAVLDAAQRGAVVQTLAVKLKANYILPAVADRLSSAIVKKNAAGGYASAATADAFSAALSKDLRELGDDKHFRAMHDERFRERANDNDIPSSAEMSEQRDMVARLGYGIEKIDHLPGNVGYIDLRGFGPTEFVGPAYTAALSLLSGTDALILDLRRNGGGRPASVAYLMSHFFPLGDERHLNDIHDRPTDSTQQYWTVATVAQRYDKPVYVLTSARTFSGGEECAYDFQTQKRATIVGEVTGGGANPVRPFSLGHGIVVAIPTGQAINPVTKTSWEHVGVKPDIAVPAAQAQRTAHLAILRGLLSSAKDERRKNELQQAIAFVEKGEAETPVYTLRQ
jgi:C-terminal processing protease CtpA/Prc